MTKSSDRATPLCLMAVPIECWLQYIHAPWTARPPFCTQVGGDWFRRLARTWHERAPRNAEAHDAS